MRRFLVAFLSLLCTTLTAVAQITGFVTDGETGDPLMSVRVNYARATKVVTMTSSQGKFSIARRQGDELVFTCIGFKPYRLAVSDTLPDEILVEMLPLSTDMKAVDVKAKSLKYTKKNNPAVDLMRRIIAANKRNNLKKNDFYEFYRYQKTTFARNDVKQEYVDSLRACGSKEWLTDQVERCELNDKLILPLQTNEKVTRSIYRKSDNDDRSIVLGENENGVMTRMSTLGDIFNAATKECFVDVDVYDDQILLLQKAFKSPISKDAVSFYHFYINDTTMVDGDECYDLYFAPANHKDVGFSGHLYALTDSSLHLRRIELTLPKETSVNFVKNMSLVQNFVKLDDGQWVLDGDDMMAELYVNKFVKDLAVIRRTKYFDYSFAPLPKSQFRGNSVTRTVPEASYRSKDFWSKFRVFELTEGEKNVDKFANSFFNRKGIKWLYLTAKTYGEGHIKTSYNDSIPSKFDIGPLSTLIGKNYIDGWRVRLSGRTTSALNPHWFWRGYVAYGFGSENCPRPAKERIYYQTEFTYSFNRKNRLPWEFPIRQLQFLSAYDIMTPSDKFLTTNKDNWMMMVHWKKVHNYYLYNRQVASFQYETSGGLSLGADMKCEQLEGQGNMAFRYNTDPADVLRKIRTTEFTAQLRYSPGETYLNTNIKRYPLTQNAPVFFFLHSVGVRKVLGGQYNSNYSELSFQKRFWLNSWGKIDFYVAGKAQWNRVPMPLLVFPMTNLSWILQRDSHTFELLDGLEFMNDRMAQWNFVWDLNGKIFNRIPLLKKLNLREVVAFSGMFGHLTDKNNPSLHPDSQYLFRFPGDVKTLDPKRPYMEAAIGIHNILKLFEVDYIYRITYRNKEHNGMGFGNWGVRFGMNFAF